MKKQLTLAVEEADIEILRRFSEKTGLTLSSMFESHIKGLVMSIKASGVLSKEKVSKASLVRMFLRGAVQGL